MSADVTPFLFARIAGDNARRFPFWHDLDCRMVSTDVTTCDCFSLATIQAECEAKLRIVALHQVKVTEGDWDDQPTYHCALCSSCCETDWRVSEYPCGTLRALAAPYADHPDYRGEWKP